MIRIASNRYAQLVASVPEEEADDAAVEVVEDTVLRLARQLYAERRRRDRFFPGDLFGEPSWDILLDLFVAGREERRVPTTSACIGANVPPTTALRWLRILEARGLVEREGDRRDGRRTFVCLTAQGVAMMEEFLRTSCPGGLKGVDPVAFNGG